MIDSFYQIVLNFLMTQRKGNFINLVLKKRRQ